MAAAIGFCTDLDLPRLWLLGWSFGTEIALKWGNDPDIEGAILLSPPLRRAGEAELAPGPDPAGQPCWPWCPNTMTTCSPRRRGSGSAAVPQAEVIGVPGARHLWVGERYVRIALNEIVRRVNPAAWPLPD